jgi:hypothetical protein
MGFILQALMGFFSGIYFGFGRTILAIVASIMAVKVIMFFIMFFVLPWVMFGVFMKLYEYTSVYMETLLASSELPGMTVQLVGVGAYIATSCKIPEALTSYLSFVAAGFMMSLIPGFRR